MAALVEKLCHEADEKAGELVGTTFFRRLRGQMRYFKVEDGFLGLGKQHPELVSQTELHLGKSAKFTAINRPDLRLTLAHLEKYEDNPFARPFRRGNLTQAKSRRFIAGQIPLVILEFKPPSPKRIIAALCFGFSKDSTGSTPSFIEIRFADTEWQCLNDHHDIRALLLKSREVPTEVVSDTRTTSERPERVESENVPDLPKTPSRRQRTDKEA